MAECVRADKHLHFLLANERMWEIDVAAHAKLVSRVDTDAAVTFADLQRPQNFQIAAFAPQPADPGVFEHLHKRLGRTIEDGYLDGIDIDVDVIDATRIDGCKEVLRRGKEYPLLHQAGSVTDAGNVVSLGFDGKVLEINAAKNNACFSRGRDQANAPTHTSVEAHTFNRRFSRNSSLEHAPAFHYSILLTTYS